MAEQTTPTDADLVRFGRSFVQSDAFRALFQEGMALVAESAAYLDGPGREDSRRLPRDAMAAYAAESMRLTARLMQVAAWLLAQRASVEGDLSPEAAAREQARLRNAVLVSPAGVEVFERLPQGLRDLVGLTARLHARLLHVDLLLAEEASAPERFAPEPAGNPVAAQQLLIRRAFAFHEGA